MKVLFVATLSLCFTTSCFAASDATKSCVLMSTAALRKIAGLEIKQSRMRPMPAEQLANWKGKSKPIIARGVVERYSYICAVSPTGQAFVQRRLNDQRGGLPIGQGRSAAI
jgi:hypothetical protein